MKASELIRAIMTLPHDAEVRIGDQIEAGPYSHSPVASVCKGADGEIIISSDDSEWSAEQAGEIELLWSPPDADETH